MFTFPLGLQTMSRLVVFNVAGAAFTTAFTTLVVAAAVVVVTTLARDSVPAVVVGIWGIILADSLVTLAKPNDKILEAGLLSCSVEDC